MDRSAVPQPQVDQLTCENTSTRWHSQAPDKPTRAPFATQSATHFDLGEEPSYEVVDIRFDDRIVYVHGLSPRFTSASRLRSARRAVQGWAGNAPLAVLDRVYADRTAALALESDDPVPDGGRTADWPKARLNPDDPLRSPRSQWFGVGLESRRACQRCVFEPNSLPPPRAPGPVQHRPQWMRARPAYAWRGGRSGSPRSPECFVILSRLLLPIVFMAVLIGP
jgi:hypothetical protein